MSKEIFIYSLKKQDFESQVQSGEIDNTRIGIIAETAEIWVKGEYYPFAPDFAKIGSTSDDSEDNTLLGWVNSLRDELEGLNSSLIFGGTIKAAYSISGRNGAQVTVSQAFRTKYNISENKVAFYIVDKRVSEGIGGSDAVYIYPSDYEGCYFVMDDFEGNDTIFSLGATKGDWIVVQGSEWVKIATQQREIAGISGNVTAEALATKLSTLTPTNADPLIKQSALEGFVRKDEAADFANDLTGVVEATPEMFTYRPSAGDKSVRDESAVIRRIKGNTSVWGQGLNLALDQTGDNGWWFRNPELGGNVIIDGNTVKYDVIPDKGSNQQISQKVGTFTVGHIYLLHFTFNNNGAINEKWKRPWIAYFATNLYGDGEVIYAPEDGSTSGVANIFHKVDTEGLQYIILKQTYIGISNSEITPTVMEFGDIQLFDLTDLFGAGNEPTTYEEFREYYPDAYYPYCERVVRSMRATGIETIGFNAFNGEYAEVIGGQTYYLGGTIDTAHFATEIGGDSVEITIPENRLYTPPTNGYVYATGSDICINLSHSGVRNGEYKPYEKNTLLLPEIAKYFPDGMHGIGDVCDEINDKMAIQRIGVVDIGSLKWKYNGILNVFHTYDISNAKRIHFSKITPAVILPYTPVTYIEEATPNMSFTLNNQRDAYNFFAIRNTNYNDANSFTEAMQGVLLYYQLAEPIYTPIDEPLQLDYKVDDFGTEKMLSDVPSAPFKADIVYQFNAEGRIRDNSRNIERLEEQLKNAKKDIQNAGVQSDWLDDNPDSKAFIKNKPTMPTQVATAPEVIETTSTPSSMLPNVVYIIFAGLARFTLPTLVDGDANAHNVWKIIFISPASSELTFPDNLSWKDGIAPNWTEAGGYCELTFTKFANSWILGEWKLYK